MSVTWAGVYHLLNVPLDDDVILPNFTNFSRSSFSCLLESSHLSYTSFLTREIGKPNNKVSFLEECSFYLYWLCKFMVCSSSKWITLGFVPIAMALALNHRLALGPFMLALLYGPLWSLIRERFFGSINGSLWLLQLWVYANFRSLSHVSLNYQTHVSSWYAQYWLEAWYPESSSLTFTWYIGVILDTQIICFGIHFLPF